MQFLTVFDGSHSPPVYRRHTIIGAGRYARSVCSVSCNAADRTPTTYRLDQATLPPPGSGRWRKRYGAFLKATRPLLDDPSATEEIEPNLAP